jgi:hypothetical protein
LWDSNINITISTNVATSPDGFINADKIIATTVNSVHAARHSANTTTSPATMSIFAKANGYNKIAIRQGSVGDFAVFNLTNGTLQYQVGAVSTSIVSYSNGFYRISATFTTTSPSLQVYILPDSYTTEDVGSFSWTGNATDGILIYGAQVEAGAYATSYIPTLGASVTRVADAASKTGISSLIGQTEGTIFFDASQLYTSGNRTVAVLWGGSGSNYIQVYILNDIRVGINGTLLLQSNNISANTRYKIAVAYKSGNHALYVNGVQVATSTSTVMSTLLNDFYLGNSFGSEQSGIYNQALLFKTRLTNAQLAELTTI